MAKEKTSEFGPQTAERVINAFTKKLSKGELGLAERDWASVYNAPLFIKMIRGINEFSQTLIDPNSPLILENIFVLPDYQTILYLVGDLVIWGNNRMVSPYRKFFSLPEVATSEHWYPQLSLECNQVIDRVQNHILALAKLVARWIDNGQHESEWRQLLVNFVEMAIINENTEYITKNFFFFRRERPDPNRTRYFVGAQLQAFERIRTTLHHLWTQHLNDVVSIINRVIQHAF